MQPDTLTEDLADWCSQLAIDSPSRLVRNVALTGPDSKNGYRYADSALREAAPLYNHKPVFLDHAADRMKPRDRSTRDLVGNIVNPRYEDGRIRGDIQVLDTDSGRTFLALANTNLQGVGMSHVVLAQRSTDGTIVEAIRDVVCVDAVINPATTRTFRESVINPDITDEACEVTQSGAAASDSSSRQSQSSAMLLEQISQLEARATKAERQLEIQKLLQEAQLPAQALSSLFLGQLEQAPTTEARLDLIRDRQTLCEHQVSRTAQSWNRRTEMADVSSADLVAAIKFRSQ